MNRQTPERLAIPTSAHAWSARLALTAAAATTLLVGATRNDTATAQVSLPQKSVSSSAAVASPWVKGHSSSVRLVAGAEPPASPGAAARVIAGVEVRMADGWKTYWRHPGDDGGIPPAFDWKGSRNLAAAEVQYPAPERLKSLNGTTLGYSRSVIFPVTVTPAASGQPIALSLNLEIGVCREICIPVEASLQLEIPANLASMPADLAAALVRVPVKLPHSNTLLRSATASLSGPAPSLTFDIAADQPASRLDLFVETLAGGYLPVPAKVADPAKGLQRFRIDLKGVEDIAALRGKPLRLTVTGTPSPAEFLWTVK